MLVDEKPPLDEDLLIHFGIKGMKWGQRKADPTSSTKERIDKLHGKLDKINGYSALQGDLNRSYGEKRSRANRREFGKVDQAKFNKMSLAEKQRFERRGANRSRTEIALKGGAATAAVLGAGWMLTSKMAATSRQAAGGKEAVVALAGFMAFKSALDLHNIATAQKRERIRYELQTLEKK